MDKIKLTEQDIHNLYDILYMVNWQDYKTFQLNRMDQWFDKFFLKLEMVVVPELFEEKKGG